MRIEVWRWKVDGRACSISVLNYNCLTKATLLLYIEAILCICTWAANRKCKASIKMDSEQDICTYMSVMPEMYRRSDFERKRSSPLQIYMKQNLFVSDSQTHASRVTASPKTGEYSPYLTLWGARKIEHTQQIIIQTSMITAVHTV